MDLGIHTKKTTFFFNVLSLQELLDVYLPKHGLLWKYSWDPLALKIMTQWRLP